MAAPAPPQSLRMLEFFSGIGGMRCAIDEALRAQPTCSKVVVLASCRAYEINRQANQVYHRNFCTSDDSNNNDGTSDMIHSVHTKLVEQLTIRDVRHSDLWTLSPPCQPFTKTRFAKQRDVEDKRMAGFLALLSLLEQLEVRDRPQWIFVENVQGFAQSQARVVMKETLLRCGYSWKEYLLSPIQLGIPNHRKRYYILCENTDRFFDRSQPQSNSAISGSTSTEFPDTPICLPKNRVIADYLDPSDTVDWGVFGLNKEVLSKPWSRDLPLVAPNDKHSHCFTAFYSRQLHQSTGSLLIVHPEIDSVASTTMLDRSQMTLYKIRKFTPRELLRIFGFPPDIFQVSKEEEEEPMRLQTQFKLIGNSINVTAVSILLHHLVVQSPS